MSRVSTAGHRWHLDKRALSVAALAVIAALTILLSGSAATAAGDAKPAEPPKPSDTAEPTKSAEPAKPAETAKPAEPAKTGETQWMLFLQDVAWSPDGKRIAFSRYHGAGEYDDRHWAVWMVNRDGSDPRRVLEGGLYTGFSPDGKRLVAQKKLDGDWELVTVKVDGTDLRRVTRRPGEDNVPSWSPDGRSLVYAAKVGDDLDLHQVAVEGGTPRRLNNDPANDYNPVASPDGRRVVFYREKRDQHDQVWTLDLATGREARVTDGTGHNFFPTFLPDGRIAYSGAADGGERRLRVVGADGRTAAVGPAGIFFARWSPDGKEIAFIRQGGKQVQRMAADGTGVTTVVDGAELAASTMP